jgi:hypothetical protein
MSALVVSEKPSFEILIKPFDHDLKIFKEQMKHEAKCELDALCNAILTILDKEDQLAKIKELQITKLKKQKEMKQTAIDNFKLRLVALEVDKSIEIILINERTTQLKKSIDKHNEIINMFIRDRLR